MADTFGFDQQSARRVRDAVKRVEGQVMVSNQPRNLGGRGGQVVQVVRVTSTTLVNGYYPAFWETYTAATNTWSDNDAVYVNPVNGSALATGRYLAMLVDVYSDGTTLIFDADDQFPASSSVAPVTNVCPTLTTVSGTQVVTAITVETTSVTLPGSVNMGSLLCNTNPAGCCARICPCCPQPVSDTLYLTLSGAGAGDTCFNGKVYALNYQGCTSCTWLSGTETDCSVTMQWCLSCTALDHLWDLIIECSYADSTCGGQNIEPASLSCNPLNIVFTVPGVALGMTTCLHTGLTATVTN